MASGYQLIEALKPIQRTYAKSLQ